MNEEKRIRCSKFLALILRHQPESVGLTLEPEGWAPLDDVLAACRKKNRALSRTELDELLALDEKKRYSLDETRTKIRANQGHSTAVELTFEERTPPALLYHGTVDRFLPSIFEQGLKPGNRHHVHLTENLETAQKVGARRGKPVHPDHKRRSDGPGGPPLLHLRKRRLAHGYRPIGFLDARRLGDRAC